MYILLRIIYMVVVVLTLIHRQNFKSEVTGQAPIAPEWKMVPLYSSEASF